MKKFLTLVFTFSLITFLIVISVPALTTVSNTNPCFARVKYNNVCFYKTPTNNYENTNILFILESSYFVKLIKDENNEYYKANYIDINGYVKKTEVECILENPETPYLNNINFSISPNNSAILRMSPTTENGDNDILIVIPANTHDITYYGKITGQEAISGLGNIWYYCSYTNAQNTTTYGYIYSPLTRGLTPINSNTEITTLSSVNHFDRINSFLNLNSTLNTVLISITILPTILILYLLFKPSKIVKNK